LNFGATTLTFFVKRALQRTRLVHASPKRPGVKSYRFCWFSKQLAGWLSTSKDRAHQYSDGTNPVDRI